MMVGFMEAEMASVERVKAYSELGDKQEAAAELPTDPKGDDPWPSEGVLEVSDLVMGYRDGPDVLKGVSFNVHGAEKVSGPLPQLLHAMLHQQMSDSTCGSCIMRFATGCIGWAHGVGQVEHTECATSP